MLEKVYKNIKSLKIQGATAVARAIIFALKLHGVGDKSKNLGIWQKSLKGAADYLLSARPTEPMAQNGVKFIFSELAKAKPKNIAQIKNYLKKSADVF